MAIHLTGRAIFRDLPQQVLGQIGSEASLAKDRQKSSICHTFLVPLASVMASNRPFGDGIAL
jgi:hypothetical protein